MTGSQIIVGDALEQLRKLPSNSIDCCVTSPPYWGLRDYGVAGQIGLEPTLGEHLAVMVEVFREVRRVLKAQGTCWLNYGDCYAAAPNGKSAEAYKADGSDDRTFRDKPFSTVGPIYDPNFASGRGKFTGTDLGHGGVGTRRIDHGGRIVAGGFLKPKDLCMIPNRLAIALQDDGWYVRSEIIWHKPNPMPESVYDRPTTAHEKVWLLSKSEDYFYNHAAIREPVTGGTHARRPGPNSRFEVETFIAQPVVADVTSTLPAGGNLTGGDRPPGTSAETAATMLIAQPIAPSMRVEGDAHTGFALGDGLVAHSLRADGFDASEDGMGRGTPLVPVAFAIQAGALRENPASGPDGVGVQADHSYTLEARAEVQAVAFAQNSRDEVRLFGEDGQTVGALGAEPGMKQQCYIAQQWAVRRLTPTECSRLMDVPDQFLRITYRGKPAADGPQYKALGNSQARNVMRWIGYGLADVIAAQKAHALACEQGEAA